MPTLDDLQLKPCGDHPVYPLGTPLPDGYGGIEISTAARPHKGLEDAAVPKIGVDGAPVAEGWGSGLIPVRPGRRLVRVSRAGENPQSRVEDVAAGQVVALDFRVAILRGKNGYYVGYPGFGPKGSTRATNQLRSGRAVTSLYTIVATVLGGAVMAASVLLGTQVEDPGLNQTLLIGPPMTVVLGMVVGLPILFFSHRNRVRREQAHEPRQWGDAWRVFEAGPFPALPPNRGALLLDLRARVFMFDAATGDVGDDWTPPPRLRVDGREIPVDFGYWWIPVEPGEHRVEVAVPGADGRDTAARARTVTVEAGATHRGTAKVRGFGAVPADGAAAKLTVGFRLK